MNEFIEFWKKFESKDGFNIHPDDEKFLNKENHHCYSTYNDYIIGTNSISKDSSKLHLGLLPVPYSGDILKAKIYILMLNPGFQPIDYFAEEKSSSYKKELLNQIYQKELSKEYPFFWLNPEFAFTGGATYWNRKLKSYFEKQKSEKAIKEFLSKNVAVIQFFPYHSATSPKGKISDFPSVKAAINFVNEYIIPKAENGEVGVIFTRKYKEWFPMLKTIKNIDNLIIYENQQSLGAHIGINTKGGGLIAKILNENKVDLDLNSLKSYQNENAS